MSFDVLSRVFGEEGFALAVGGGEVRLGSSRGSGDGIYRAEPQIERDSGDSFFDTTDTRIRRQYRTAFCALELCATATNQQFIYGKRVVA